MAQPLWQFGLYDENDGWLADLNLATSKEITRQKGAPMLHTGQLPLTSEAAYHIQSGRTYVKGYRTPPGGTRYDREIKFHGPCWTDEISTNGTNDMLMYTAISPHIYLTKRFTNANYSASATDRGAIIKAIIDTTNAVDDTGIYTGAGLIETSSTATPDWRTDRPSIADVINQFADALDGCDTMIEPIEYASGKIGQLQIYSGLGSLQQDAVFGYGPGTVNNCLINRVRNAALIDNDVLGYTSTLAANWVNTTSINTYRRQYSYMSFTDETSATELSARTKGYLDAHETLDAVAEYSFTPGPRAPRLYDDFDVGDTVPVWFKRGNITFDTTQRVYSVTLRIDDNGVEIPSQIETRAA